MGFRCYEPPEILYAAQANLLTSEPNPTYLSTSVQIDKDAARRLLMRRQIDVAWAKDFGAQLKEKTAKIKAQNAALA